ncbi:MAG: SCP2 sterol-binding domain-containing protein [Rhodobacteraceae bacterium]|nr:SCP2 sterol-binding domain-containing protein [Paracoccaceae bacterium]
MSDVVTAAVAALSEKITGPLPGSVKFVIEDEGAVLVDEAGVRATDDEAEVTLTADAETFEGILKGDLNPTAAFMSGRLKIDGNMGLAMQLASALT